MADVGVGPASITGTYGDTALQWMFAARSGRPCQPGTAFRDILPNPLWDTVAPSAHDPEVRLEDRAMTATEPKLDLFALPATELLSTDQVGSLKLFGAAASLTHNRSVGRPGPRYSKVGSRIFYRVSDLLAYVAQQQIEADAQIEARSARFEKRARRGVS